MYFGAVHQNGVLHRVILGEAEAAEDVFFRQAGEHGVGVLGQREGHFVEHRGAEGALDAVEGAELVGQLLGVGVAVAGDAGEAVRAQQGDVDGGGGHGQALVGADVTGGLGAADVLLAGLQGEGEALFAFHVHGAADDAAGHLAHVFFLAGHEAEVRAAGAERHAQGLAFAHDHIGALLAPLARGREDRQGRRVGDGDHQHAVGVGPVGEGVHVFQAAEVVGLADHQGGVVVACERAEAVHQGLAGVSAERHGHQLHVLVADDGFAGAAVARVERVGHQHLAAFRFAVGAQAHEHRFRQAGGAVVDGGVGDVHAGEPGDQGLVFVDHLQGALAGFRLVRGVGGVELTAGGDFPYRRRDVVRVGAAAEEAEREAVLLGALGHQAGHFHLAAPFGQGVEAVAGFQVGGDFIEQVLDAVGANRLEHGLDVVRSMGDIGHWALPDN